MTGEDLTLLSLGFLMSQTLAILASMLAANLYILTVFMRQMNVRRSVAWRL